MGDFKNIQQFVDHTGCPMRFEPSALGAVEYGEATPNTTSLTVQLNWKSQNVFNTLENV